MRIERTYWCMGSQPDPRVPVSIETIETYYCEDPACEAKHDDPTILWDKRVSRQVAEVNRLVDAEKIVSLLREHYARAKAT